MRIRSWGGLILIRLLHGEVGCEGVGDGEGLTGGEDVVLYARVCFGARALAGMSALHTYIMMDGRLGRRECIGISLVMLSRA